MKILISLAGCVLCAAGGARLPASDASPAGYLQIFVDQFAGGDPAVPPEVQSAVRAPFKLEAREASGREWRASAAGLLEIRPGGLRFTWRPADGLPILTIAGIAAGSRGGVWLAASDALVFFDPSAPAGQRWYYFAGRRYLAGGEVLGLAPAPRGAWVRSAGGISRIEFRPYTLERKAAYFEARLALRHRRHGFVDDCAMAAPGDLAHCVPQPSDNDGLWTAIYAAAECFRYKATGSPEALENADSALAAVLSLEAVTGIPGFPARAIAGPGEPREAGGEWHPAGDGRSWKGDTSSDELVGHFLADWAAWTLLPAGGSTRREAAGEAGRIARRLVEHGLLLVGPDGRVTRWGRYTPEYFRTPEGREDAGLDSLEILSHLRVAAALTGDAALAAEYRRVAFGLRYLDHVAELGSVPAEVNYSDEELAYLSFAPLLLPLAAPGAGPPAALETDPTLAARYRSALGRFARRTRDEHNPLWELIAAAGTGGRAGSPQAARDALERVPMETVNWTAPNDARADIAPGPRRNRFGRRQSARALPPNERAVMKWNGDPFELGSRRLDGDGGHGEDDGAFFLLPYWMGRCFKVIDAN